MPGHPPAAIRPWTTAKKGTLVPCNLPIVVTLAGVTVETFGPFIRNYIGTRRIKVIVIHISANVNTIRHISLFSSVMHKESCGLFVFFVNGRQFQKYPSRGGQHPPLIPDFRKHPDERIRPVGAARSRPQPRISASTRLNGATSDIVPFNERLCLVRLRADSIRPYGLGGEAAAIQRTAQLRTLREAKSLPYRTQKLSVFLCTLPGGSGNQRIDTSPVRHYPAATSRPAQTQYDWKGANNHAKILPPRRG